MNEYRWEDLYVGMKEQFEVVVDEKKMQAFLEMTNDVNPLHTDAHFAREKGFRDRVVYGMLSASMLSTLAGVYLPGKYSLIQQTEAKFVKPVFVNDRLTVIGEIAELNDSVNQIVIKVNMVNQLNEKVLRGVLKVVLQNG